MPKPKSGAKAQTSASARRPPPGGRAGAAVRPGSGGVEPVPLPLTAYVHGGCVTSQSRRAITCRGHQDICCLNVEGPVERLTPAVAAFFDLDKTVISKSSTLAFGRPFYRHGLISRADALRSVACQLVFPVAGANHGQMERIKEWVGGLCRGWPVDRVTAIVAHYLDELILPYVYAEARALIAAHREA